MNSLWEKRYRMKNKRNRNSACKFRKREPSGVCWVSANNKEPREFIKNVFPGDSCVLPNEIHCDYITLASVFLFYRHYSKATIYFSSTRMPWYLIYPKWMFPSFSLNIFCILNLSNMSTKLTFSTYTYRNCFAQFHTAHWLPSPTPALFRYVF